MTLDRQLEVLLSRAEGLRLPSLVDHSPEQARAAHRATGLASNGADRTVAMRSVTGTSVPTLAGRLELRTYRPTDCPVPSPAIVYLHGGGWVLGDLDLQDATCRYLADRCRAVVVSVGYRLAPEHPYPAAIDDSCAAVMWTQRHAEELGVDTRRLAIAGSSAGGNVAAGTTLRLRDEGLTPLSAQLLLYPPTDPLLSHPSVDENSEGYYLTAQDMRCFVDAYLPDRSMRRLPYAGPLHADSLAGLPPAVVTTAGHDPLRDEGMAYVAKLRASGVSVRHLHFPELIHGFFAFARHSQAAARARDEVLDAFATLLAAKSPAVTADTRAVRTVDPT